MGHPESIGPCQTFEDFYKARHEGLHRYATVVAGHASAEDACQEAWLRMWRAWGSADSDRLDAWARQVVRNCCIDKLKVASRQALATLDDPVDPTSSAEELAVRREEAAIVSACLRSFPAHLKQVLWMREVMGLSYADIAQSLQIPIGTVMSRLHTGRRKLAKRMVR